MQLFFRNTTKSISDFCCIFNSSVFLQSLEEESLTLPFDFEDMELLESMLSSNRRSFTEIDLLHILCVGSFLQVEGEKWNSFKKDFIRALDWRSTHYNENLEKLLEEMIRTQNSYSCL